METITLTSPDISCDHCKTTIERELSGLTGIQMVAVDIPSKQVEVTYDPAQLAQADIVAKLEDEGYAITL